MALADIVKHIADDAASEGALLVAHAQERAENLIAEARAEAERARAKTLERAARDAEAEAETLRASARLGARDRALATKGVLVDRVLAQARDAILALGDDEYAELLARRVARTACGGERVLMAPADVARLASQLPVAVARVTGGDLRLTWASELAPIEHGVVLRGDRVSVDLSVDAAIEERRDELVMIAAERLFGEAEA